LIFKTLALTHGRLKVRREENGRLRDNGLRRHIRFACRYVTRIISAAILNFSSPSAIRVINVSQGQTPDSHAVNRSATIARRAGNGILEIMAWAFPKPKMTAASPVATTG